MKPEFEVIRLKGGDAKEVAKVLTDVFGDRGGSFRVVAETTSNSIIVLGSPLDVETVKKLVEKLSVPGGEKQGRP